MDTSNVYWTAFSSGVLAKVPLAGGTVSTLATGLSSPRGVAVRSPNVYWVNSGGGAEIEKRPRGRWDRHDFQVHRQRPAL